jgi:two-component system chemotaxis response regulator CheB
MTRIVVAGGSDIERAALCAVLHGDGTIETAALGPQLANIVNAVKRLDPHLVVLAMEEGRSDSMEAARRIMGESPRPIVLVATAPVRDKEEILARSGALAVLDAPVGTANRHRFVTMLKAMSEVKVVRRWGGKSAARPPAVARSAPGMGRLVAIASSTGGPSALQQIFSNLPPDFAAPILVVQHIAGGFADSLVHSLSASTVAIRLAREGDTLKPRTVYIAPDDRHMGVTSRNTVTLSAAPPIEGFRPSATFLFEAAAKVFGPQLTAVVLTGMGRDGIAGLPIVRELGGKVIAQDSKTSTVFGMPKAAIESGYVDQVLPLGEIARELSPPAAMQGVPA